MDRAVAAAREGFAVWSATTGAERSRILLRAAAILRERNDDLARIEVRDTGKPIAEALTVDVASGADCLEFFAAAGATLARRVPRPRRCVRVHAARAARRVRGDRRVELPDPDRVLEVGTGARVWQRRGLQTLGAHAAHRDGARRDLHRCRRFRRACSTSCTAAARSGAALAGHPGIAKISLTGSVPTGRRVMAASSETLKALTLELGGKSPLLVFDDADLDQAVVGVHWSRTSSPRARSARTARVSSSSAPYTTGSSTRCARGPRSSSSATPWTPTPMSVR